MIFLFVFFSLRTVMLFITANLDQDLGRVATLPDGSETVPPLAFQGDGDTGIFRRALNTLSVTTGSAERMYVDHEGLTVFGNVVVGNTLVTPDAIYATTVVANSIVNPDGNPPGVDLTSVESNIVAAGAQYTLGTPQQPWSNAFLTSVHLGDTSITESSGTVTFPGTVNATAFTGDGSGLTGVGGSGVPLTVSNIQITDDTWTPIGATTVPQTGGFILVNGSGFGPGTVIDVGTDIGSTEFVSLSQVRAFTPVKSVSEDTTYDVTVVRGDAVTATLPASLTYS